MSAAIDDGDGDDSISGRISVCDWSLGLQFCWAGH